MGSEGGFRTRYALWQIITELEFIFDVCIVLVSDSSALLYVCVCR